MKKKEAILAISLATAMATTGCASQTDIDALNNQVAELTAQVSELETELSNAQTETANATDKSEELESQVAELQAQLESAEGELEDAESIIKSVYDDTEKMTINVTKYAQEETAIYTKAEEENEENKIAELDMNDEAYVVSIFSGVDGNSWSAVGALKTTNENGDVTYQIITGAEKGEERIKNNKIDYFFRKMTTITVDGKTIKADELGENQEIRIVYARTSLLSNSKVTEQQHTSAEKSSTPKQTQQQGSSTDGRIPDADYSWWDNTPSVGTDNVTDNLGGINLQFH